MPGEFAGVIVRIVKNILSSDQHVKITNEEFRALFDRFFHIYMTRRKKRVANCRLLEVIHAAAFTNAKAQIHQFLFHAFDHISAILQTLGVANVNTRVGNSYKNLNHESSCVTSPPNNINISFGLKARNCHILLIRSSNLRVSPLDFTTIVPCFQATWMAKLWNELYPLKPALSFESLVFGFIQDDRLSASERQRIFSDLLEPREKPHAGTWLQTLEALRQALVLNHEDVDYCFSLLAETPRNSRLADLLHAYTDSELAKDFPLHAWTVLEHLKGQEVELDKNLLFVTDESASELFSEFAKHVPSAQVKSAWELSEPFPNAFIHRSSKRSLVTLSETLLARAKDSKIWLPFAGTEEEFAYITYFAKRHTLTLRTLGRESQKDSRTTTRPLSSHWLARLRSNFSIALKTRLKLSDLILSSEIELETPEQWTNWLAKMKSGGLLLQEEETILEALPTDSSFNYKESSDIDSDDWNICIVPFHPFPFPPDARVIAYSGPNVLNMANEHMEISSREADALNQKGFSLLRAGEKRALSKRFMALFASGYGSEQLFTDLEVKGAKTVFTNVDSVYASAATAPAIEMVHVDAPIKSLSATQLETYSKCPSQYFFSNVLKFRPKLSGEGAYSLRFGQATHLALEEFFKNQCYEPSLLLAEFEKALAKIIPFHTTSDALHIILTENFKKIALNVADLEKRLQNLFGETRPIAFERSFRLDMEGAVLTGKIDRVDMTKDGHVLVLDYKTGTVDFSPNHTAQGSNFQALIYVIASEMEFKKPAAGMLFYDLKQGEIKRGLVKEITLFEDGKKRLTRGHALSEEAFNKIIEQGLGCLRDLARSIEQGTFTPTPEPSICATCAYPVFCGRASGRV
jgi:RecB family exonuclease